MTGGILEYSPKIWNSLIDLVVFYTSNLILHVPLKIQAPGIDHSLIFFTADVITRNFIQLPFIPKDLNLGYLQDVIVAIIYALTSIGYDLLAKGDSYRKAITDNLWRAAVGAGGNVAVDYFVIKTKFQ